MAFFSCLVLLQVSWRLGVGRRKGPTSTGGQETGAPAKPRPARQAPPLPARPPRLHLSPSSQTPARECFVFPSPGIVLPAPSSLISHLAVLFVKLQNHTKKQLYGWRAGRSEGRERGRGRETLFNFALVSSLIELIS